LRSFKRSDRTMQKPDFSELGCNLAVASAFRLHILSTT